MSNDRSTRPVLDASRVSEWLVVGGEILDAEDMAELVELGVTTVINAACEVSDRWLCEHFELGYYNMYWHDDQQHKSAHEFLHVYHWLLDEEAKLAEAGEPLRVYVHCQMGINRGPLLATFLLAAREGLTADDAWERVRTSRPIATAFGKPVYRDACMQALEEHRRK